MIEASSPISAIFDGVAARVNASSVPVRSLAVTSTLHGEGSTTVALGLAMSLAGYDSKAVLLVDANWLRPSLSADGHRIHAPGLAEYLRGELALDDAVVPAARKDLWLLPAGRFGDELPPLGRLAKLIDDIGSRFGKTVVDLPPVLVAPALVVPWASAVDQTYLVMRHGTTPVGLIRKAVAELGPHHAPQLILNRSRLEGAALSVAYGA
ncbi:MAG: CpsD/CapB family tyrosine-protein kinase [Chloroflexi bacterium]|nr:MAG: CpsD/CapB family tyrosine-protein kinase [Chloroflexota bacterium]